MLVTPLHGADRKDGRKGYSSSVSLLSFSTPELVTDLGVTVTVVLRPHESLPTPQSCRQPLTFAAGDNDQGCGTVTFRPRVGGSTFFSMTVIRLCLPLSIFLIGSELWRESSWLSPTQDS